MDPIDAMAARYAEYCQRAVRVYEEIEFVFKACDTQQQALGMLERMQYTQYVDPVHPENLGQFSERYRLALDSLEDIVRLAKKVFIYNHFESEKNRAFCKEVSFSFACKLLSQYGPLLCHFSGCPTHKQVIDAEIGLACRTPYLRFNAETDLYCLETMRGDASFHRLMPSPQSACL